MFQLYRRLHKVATQGIGRRFVFKIEIQLNETCRKRFPVFLDIKSACVFFNEERYEMMVANR